MLGSGRISRRDGAHTALLYSYPGTFAELAPSLLLLYGDVEVRRELGVGGTIGLVWRFSKFDIPFLMTLNVKCSTTEHWIL